MEKPENGYFHRASELKELVNNLPDDTVILCQVVAEDGTIWSVFPELSGVLDSFKWKSPVAALTLTHPELKTLIDQPVKE